MKPALKVVSPAVAPVARRRRQPRTCACSCHQPPALTVESVAVVQRGVRRELDPLAWASYYTPLPGAPDPLWRAFLRAATQAFFA